MSLEVRYTPQPYERTAFARVSQIVGGLTPAEAGPTTGELAGTCALVFAAGSSTLAGSTGTLTATNAAQMVFGHGSSTLGGSAGALTGTNAIALIFGHGSSALTISGALVGTNAAAMVFGHAAVLTQGGALAGAAGLVFGHGTSTLLGAGALVPESIIDELRLKLFFTPVGTLDVAGALAGASALVFGHDADLSGELEVIQTPIVIMAPRLAL